ncbi:hypothetical protein M4D58_23775 [Brevibacillus borstelensis]|uniref:hypothetical protein n=1 Tax=Brevibacillus borstelensis TaxID=45462 RepID=UPI00204129EF|nr:hypothetical protein [Brevibacillus borstelensis]MCM3593645.1 hypothetical protein [Brevibacillus borstelensis]
MMKFLEKYAKAIEVLNHVIILVAAFLGGFFFQSELPPLVFVGATLGVYYGTSALIKVFRSREGEAVE